MNLKTNAPSENQPHCAPHSEPQNAEQLRIEFVSKKKREVKVGGEQNGIVGDILTLIRLNVLLKRVCAWIFIICFYF